MIRKIKKIFTTVLYASILSAPFLIKAQFCAPGIGDKAPSFVASSTKGKIHFPTDYKNKWVIFFSHPSDFTPVCETEFKRLSKMIPEFEALNCKLIGLSVDSKYIHKAWLKSIERESDKKINFPVISDTSKKVAKLYGMIHPNANKTETVRAVYFIDPLSTLRAIFYYPITNGRNFDEIKRLLIALQTTDRDKVITPAGWRPKDKAIPKLESK